MSPHCAGCGSEEELERVRERRPGAKGLMAQSFWADYYLCQSCIGACEGAACVDFRRIGKRKRDTYTVVFANALRWIKTVVVTKKEPKPC